MGAPDRDQLSTLLLVKIESYSRTTAAISNCLSKSTSRTAFGTPDYYRRSAFLCDLTMRVLALLKLNTADEFVNQVFYV